MTLLAIEARMRTVFRSVVILSSFDPGAAPVAIERHRVINMQWAPTMFVRLFALTAAARARYDLSNHRIVLHVAAPCPIAVKRATIDCWGIPSTNSVGAATMPA